MAAVRERRRVEDTADGSSSTRSTRSRSSRMRKDPSSGPTASRARRRKHMPWSWPSSSERPPPPRWKRQRDGGRPRADPRLLAGGGIVLRRQLGRSGSPGRCRHATRGNSAGTARTRQGDVVASRGRPRRKSLAAIPALRAAAHAAWDGEHSRRGWRSADRTARVSSVDPSSTTSTSKSTPACPRRLSTLARSVCARSYVGSTTQTSAITSPRRRPPARRRRTWRARTRRA